MSRPKFRYEILSPDGKKVVTGNMREAARLGVEAAGGKCRVLLLGDRNRVVGRGQFRTQSVVDSNDASLKYHRHELLEKVNAG